MAIQQYKGLKMTTKIAIVTGGSRGLGKNTALSLAKKGHDVIITYNSKQAEANEVVKEIEALGQKAVALQLNVADSQSFTGFADQVNGALKQKWNSKHFDFLVNNVPLTWSAKPVNDWLSATFNCSATAFRPKASISFTTSFASACLLW